MRLKFVGLASLAMMVASPFAAHAADLNYGSVKDDYVPAPPPFTWSGAYFGAHAGGAWGESDLKERLPGINIFGDDLLPASLNESYDVDGFIGGVQVGVRRQYGAWVFGGELNLSGADIDGSTGRCAGLANELDDPGFAYSADTRCSSQVNWVASALFKAGYAWQRWHVFGSVGWAVAGVDHAATLSAAGEAGVDPVVPFAGNVSWAENEVADGIAFGGGIEYAFDNDVVFGVEYTRMNLEADGSGLALGGLATTGQRDIDLNVVKATLSIKLNGPN